MLRAKRLQEVGNARKQGLHIRRQRQKLGPDSLVNRESPDGSSQLPTLVAQWASGRQSRPATAGFRMIGANTNSFWRASPLRVFHADAARPNHERGARALHERFEASSRAAFSMPEEAMTAAVSLDRVMVPIKDGEHEAKRPRSRAAGEQTEGPAGDQDVGSAPTSPVSSSVRWR